MRDAARGPPLAMTLRRAGATSTKIEIKWLKAIEAWNRSFGVKITQLKKHGPDDRLQDDPILLKRDQRCCLESPGRWHDSAFGRYQGQPSWISTLEGAVAAKNLDSIDRETAEVA